MPTYHLDLRSSDNWGVSLPVVLPESMVFRCFVPTVGICSAACQFTTPDPYAAEVGSVVVDGLDGLNPVQEEAAGAQARVVLTFVLERLKGLPPLPAAVSLAAVHMRQKSSKTGNACDQAGGEKTDDRAAVTCPRCNAHLDAPQDVIHRATLQSIANMAHAEAMEWEEWESLPEEVRASCHVMPLNPEKQLHAMPSTAALAAFLARLLDEAKSASDARAQELADEAEDARQRALGSNSAYESTTARECVVRQGAMVRNTITGLPGVVIGWTLSFSSRRYEVEVMVPYEERDAGRFMDGIIDCRSRLSWRREGWDEIDTAPVLRHHLEQLPSDIAQGLRKMASSAAGAVAGVERTGHATR